MISIAAAVGRLRTFYGPLPQPPHDPFTLFVWEVLSVHSTPRKRDAALSALKRMRALTPDTLWRAPQKKLDEAVLLAGPYLEQRIKALRTGVALFRRSPQLPHVICGPLAPARRALRGLPQMGEGGAYRMLLFAGDHAVLPVDARLARVVRRLGIVDGDDRFPKLARAIRDAAEAQLRSAVDAYRQAFVYLSHHGASTCTDANPHCGVCPLLRECPFGKRRSEIGLQSEI